jgi:hypothetical protein
MWPEDFVVRGTTMALSALDDRSKTPDAGKLARVLGRSSSLWDTLIADLQAEYDPLTEKWSFSGAKYGWSLGLKHKKRTVLYLIPQRGYFLVAFVLGGKAIAAAHESDLPPAVVKAIDGAKQYPEGRGVRLEVRKKKELAAVEQLAAIKMAN